MVIIDEGLDDAVSPKWRNEKGWERAQTSRQRQKEDEVHGTGNISELATHSSVAAVAEAKSANQGQAVPRVRRRV